MINICICKDCLSKVYNVFKEEEITINLEADNVSQELINYWEYSNKKCEVCKEKDPTDLLGFFNKEEKDLDLIIRELRESV